MGNTENSLSLWDVYETYWCVSSVQAYLCLVLNERGMQLHCTGRKNTEKAETILKKWEAAKTLAVTISWQRCTFAVILELTN